MINLGLSRITTLLASLGQPGPPRKWLAIHIAGTNGKGSVAAYISSLLSQSGLRVGKFTSPHLIDRWDCITISQRTISESLFTNVEQEVKAHDLELRKAGKYDSGERASEFELLTATAFRIFDQENVDVGVVECGVGGLRDATNVLSADQVAISVITKIGLDHQGLLGDTVEEIAEEKAGIIKTGGNVIVDRSNVESVKEIFRTKATEVGARYHESAVEQDGEWTIGLQHHQRQNLAVARQVIDVLASTQQQLGIAPDSLDYSKTVAEVRSTWQGRLHWVSIQSLTGREENVLLDGAHNAQSAEALRDYVENHVRVSEQGVVWVIAISKGKDIEQMLDMLVKPEDIVLATEFGPVEGMPWVQSEGCRAILDAAKRMGKRADCFPRPWVALERAANFAESLSPKKRAPLVIAGSLYLVSDVLRMLRSAPGVAKEDSWNMWVKEQECTLQDRHAARDKALNGSNG